MTLTIPPTPKLSELNDHVDKLQKELNTTITIIPEKSNHSSLVSDNSVSIEIVGIPSQVEQCRVRTLVLLDELLVRNNKEKFPCFEIIDICLLEKRFN